jgi:hypothetical protein
MFICSDSDTGWMMTVDSCAGPVAAIAPRWTLFLTVAYCAEAVVLLEVVRRPQIRRSNNDNFLGCRLLFFLLWFCYSTHP